jgi:serine/threonine protein kinase
VTAIAHYNLLERIGEGGIGEVWRARDTKVGRTVALKRVSPAIAANPERLARFLEDARAAMTLSHPNIATLFDVGEADGEHYLAYEYAAGRSLREECGGASMNARRAVDLAVQLADGVSDGHSHSVIHGDLRPETIIVTGKGSAKILDFGLAAWTHGGDARSLAAQAPDAVPPALASISGYLSPEQALGGAVDTRTDIFSLGTIAYEMLTGVNPFVAPTSAQTVMRVIQGHATPPSQANTAVPKDLDPILAKAMTTDLEHRQQSAASFAAELRSVGAVLDVRTGDNVHTPDVLPLDVSPDRNASLLLTTALVLAAAAAAGIWWWLSR